MIEAKGGLDRLGFDGLLAGLVRLCVKPSLIHELSGSTKLTFPPR